MFLAVGLDFAKEVHGDHLPFDPDSCPRLAEIRSALQFSPTRRELLESIKSKLRARAPEWVRRLAILRSNCFQELMLSYRACG